VSAAGFASALSAWAGAVTLLTIAEGRDDIGTTVSSFCPVSATPPTILVSLLASGYPAEVLGRADRFAITLLSTAQRALAGRFAAAGRPGARLLLGNVPRRRRGSLRPITSCLSLMSWPSPTLPRLATRSSGSVAVISANSPSTSADKKHISPRKCNSASDFCRFAAGSDVRSYLPGQQARVCAIRRFGYAR
jgi:hypothetical protein